MEDCNKDPCVRLFFAGCFLLLPREKEKPDTQVSYVWTGKFLNPERKMLRIQKYPDTCRRGLSYFTLFFCRGGFFSGFYDFLPSSYILFMFLYTDYFLYSILSTRMLINETQRTLFTLLLTRWRHRIIFVRGPKKVYQSGPV